MADKKFADYIKELMAAIPQVNGNPMMSVTSMTDANARYREDPFYISRQRQADQLALDEEEKRRLAVRSGGGGGGNGMFGKNNTPYDSGSGKVELTKEQLDWLERETLDERGNRIKNDLFGLAPIGATLGGGMLGLGSYFNSQTPTLNDLMYQQARYNKTPAELQWMLPDSYQKANERISEYNSIMNGITPYEDITPIFDIPGVSDNGGGGGGGSGAPYSPSSDGYSATGDGTGNYSTPTMSDPYGGVI